MGSPDMTSVSVSFEVRRQLNSMRALGSYSSVDELLLHMLKAHRLIHIQTDGDRLRSRITELDDIDVAGLIARLDLSPYEE
ncbi:MAG: hypothetical protein CXX72_05065 [Methanobacteriota archaeon]|nr:MAG: hypothetical protein CXX72_05065 [Euryarchaeota archaeon]